MGQNPISEFVDRFPPDIVVFVGAGASVRFGMPLMNTFFYKYFPNFSKDKVRSFKPYVGISGDDVMLHCMKALYQSQMGGPGGEFKPDLEDVLEYMIDISKRLRDPEDRELKEALNLAITAKYGDPVLNKIGKDDFYKPELWGNFITEISKSTVLLTEKLHEVYSKPVNDVEVNSCYEPFFRLLSLLTRKDITVFTTNYDCCLDVFLPTFAPKVQRYFVNGFVDNYGNITTWDSKNFSLISDSKVIAYFNLHGSVLWKEVEGKYEYVKPSALPQVNPGKTALEAPVVGKGRIKLCSTLKGYYAEILKRCKPKWIFVIGYSFRDPDIYTVMANHLTANIEANVVNISPSGTNKISERIEKRFFGVKANFGDLGYVKEIARILRNRGLIKQPIPEHILE